jgi:hypothetical protein
VPKIVVYAIVATALIGAAWGAVAWHASVHYQRGYDKAAQECKDAAAALRAIEAEEAALASSGREKDREQTRVVFKRIEIEIEKVVDRPVYRDRCFDDDGLRYANAALAGALTPTGEPHGAVPGADATRRQLGAGGAEEAGGSGSDVPRLPEPPPPAR